MIILENVALAPLTTLKVGGPARYFVEASTTEEVQEAVAFSKSRNLPLFILGGGSNLVVADSGWPGLVLKVAISGIKHTHEREKILLDVGAGEEWDKFVATMVGRNLAGVECLSGIPGSVGGTPVQNVGAYGQEVSQTIESLEVLNIPSGELCEMSNQECGFQYRTSIFNSSARGQFIVLRVSYALTPGGAPHLEYADLKKHFEGWQETPTLADTREAVRKIRAAKGMLIVDGDNDCRSAGSFFKNPVLSATNFEALNQACGSETFADSELSRRAVLNEKFQQHG